MEPENKLPEIQKILSHHSEDTEQIEKLESDKNSVDIQSSSSKPPKTPPEMKEEKEEKIDRSEKKDFSSPEKMEKVDNEEQKVENIEKDEIKLEKPENNAEILKNEEKKEIIEKTPKNKEKIANDEKVFLVEEDKKEEKKEVIREETPKASSEKNPNLLAQFPAATADLFKKNAEKKKLELEIEQKQQKAEKQTKKRLLSTDEQKTLSNKKERFPVVRRWDNERSQILNQAISLVDKLLIRLDQKIRISTIQWQNIIVFLKERIALETDYVKTMSKMGKLMKSLDKDGKGKKSSEDKKAKKEEILTGLEMFMVEMDDAHLKKAKNLTDYCMSIEKDLIKDLLQKEMEDYEKEIITNKKNIETLRKCLSELNFQTAQKAKNYSKLYTETINDVDFEVNEKKDLFLMEMTFVAIAKKQSQSIKELLIEVLKFIEGFIRLEKKKQKNLQKLFEDYLKKSIQAHGNDVFGDLIAKLDLVKDQDIEELNNLQSFIAQEDLRIFKREFETLENLKKFLEDEYKGVELSDEYSLLTSKFQAFVKIGHNYEPFNLFFTKDRNLILWRRDSGTGEVSEMEAMACMKVEGLGVYTKEKENNIVEIVQNVPGLIFSSKKTIMVKTEENEVWKRIIESLHKK